MFSDIKSVCDAILEYPSISAPIPESESNETIGLDIYNELRDSGLKVLSNIIKEYAVFEFGFAELLAKTKDRKFEFLEWPINSDLNKIFNSDIKSYKHLINDKKLLCPTCRFPVKNIFIQMEIVEVVPFGSSATLHCENCKKLFPDLCIKKCQEYKIGNRFIYYYNVIRTDDRNFVVLNQNVENPIIAIYKNPKTGAFSYYILLDTGKILYIRTHIMFRVKIITIADFFRNRFI